MDDDSLALSDKVVAVPESRQLDILADMIEKRGGCVIRCPLVSIYDVPDPEPVVAWINQFIQSDYDYFIILTGEGVRRLVDLAERRNLKESFVASLAKVHKLCRGPKPGKALRELGLKVDQLAVGPTTDGVIETLEELDITAKKVAVQLYGTEPNEKLIGYLHSRTVAEVLSVAPYIYAAETEDVKVKQLIEAIVAGQVDIMAFTSQPQIKRLFAVARANQLQQQLIDGLKNMDVAAVGPLVEAALQSHGIQPSIRPENSFFMKPMIRKMVEVVRK